MNLLATLDLFQKMHPFSQLVGAITDVYSLLYALDQKNQRKRPNLTSYHTELKEWTGLKLLAPST